MGSHCEALVYTPVVLCSCTNDILMCNIVQCKPTNLMLHKCASELHHSQELLKASL